MSLTGLADRPVPTDQLHGDVHRARPCLKSIAVRVAASLWVSVIVPALLFTASLLLFNVPTALVVALVWFYGAITWRWATGQRQSGMLALMVVVMTVRTGFTLMTGNTFIYFFQPIFVDAVLAVVFLLSLATTRPVVARLAADFYPMDRHVAARRRIRRLFWYLTLMWGLVCLVKCGMGYWLLVSQSLVNFVLIKNVAVLSLTALSITVTVWISLGVARKEGLFAPAPA
jgi:hypothetical protein